MTIYQDDLMYIYKNPSNLGTLDDPSVTVHKKNPGCGDELDLYLRIENNVIKDIKYSGSACMIGIVSSSLLTEELKGKTIDQAKSFTKERLLSLIGVNLTTSRVKCATLVLSALEDAIAKYENEK